MNMCDQAFSPEREFAFPDRPDIPAESFQIGGSGAVALDIATNLCAPEFNVRFGCCSLPAVMPMPKTPMNENYESVPREDDIGPAWQIRTMQAESKPIAVKCAPHGHLWLGVLRLDTAHQPRARLGIPTVDHSGRMTVLGSGGNG